jgi:hypothetical protein
VRIKKCILCEDDNFLTIDEAIRSRGSDRRSKAKKSARNFALKIYDYLNSFGFKQTKSRSSVKVLSS